MRIDVQYGGREYPIEHSQDNIEALRQVGHYVSQGVTETLILGLAGGGTLIVVVGPAVPFAVSYRD